MNKIDFKVLVEIKGDTVIQVITSPFLEKELTRTSFLLQWAPIV